MRTRRSAWGSSTASPAARIFLGVLPALALPTRGASVEYIAAIGVGTVVVMTAFAAVIGSVRIRVQYRVTLHRGTLLTAATLAIAVGAYWLI